MKFDDLCENFKEHEALDSSGALITAALDMGGAITDMTLAFGADAGLVPLTVPTSQAASVS